MNPKENLTEQIEDKEPKTRAEKQIDKLYLIIKIATIVFVLLAIEQTFGPFVLEYVSGESMYPTFNNGDLIVVDRRRATVGNIKAGDIVIAKGQRFEDQRLIKRVIGTPGDAVSFKLNEDGELKTWIKRDEKVTLLDEPYLNEPMNTADFTYDEEGLARTSSGAQYGWICENGEYIIMGDNRNASLDSRKYGKFTTEDIKGKVVLRLFPFTKY